MSGTREIDDRFWDLLGGATPIQSGALPRVVPARSQLPEGSHERRRTTRRPRQAQRRRRNSLLSTYLPTSARPFLRACLLHKKSPQRGHQEHPKSRRFRKRHQHCGFQVSRGTFSHAKRYVSWILLLRWSDRSDHALLSASDMLSDVIWEGMYKSELQKFS